MAAYSCVARWLLNEASSGTTPTTVADDQGANDLTIDYSSGDAAWTSIAAGNALDFTATPAATDGAIAELADIASNGNIGSSFDGETGCSIIAVVQVDDASASGSRILHIGTATGDCDIGIIHTDLDLIVRFDDEADGSAVNFPSLLGNGVTVIAVVIDTTQATASNRIRVWYDGVQQSSVFGTQPAQNTSLGAINSSDRSACIGNRPSQNRGIDGRVYYLELGTGQLDSTQISDSNTALAADNDTDWNASGVADLVLNSANFTVTANSVGLTASRLLSANSASFTVTAQDVGLDLTRQIGAQSASYSITPTDVGLFGSRLLSLQSQSYAITGTDIGLLRAAVLSAQSATFAITPTDLALAAASYLATQSAAYAITPTDVGLFSARLLSLQSQSFVITPTDVVLELAGSLILQSADFAITPTDVGLIGSRLLALNSASYTVTPTDIELTAGGANIVALSASFTITPTDVGLVASRLLSLQSAGYLVTAQSVGLDFGTSLAMASASFSITPQTLDLIASRLLSLQTRAFAITPRNVNLIYSNAAEFPDIDQPPSYSSQSARFSYTSQTPRYNYESN